jgi:hypothetical protein
MELRPLLVAHAVPTLCLCGLIWFVQLVHYALYPHVGAEQFVAYEQEHCRRITPLVLPLMLAELALCAALVWFAPAGAMRSWAIAGALLLAVVWATTFLQQVPCHQILEQRADHAAMARLLATNWIRTIAWTLRGLVAVRLLLW